jgi:hypothetical protein
MGWNGFILLFIVTHALSVSKQDRPATEFVTDLRKFFREETSLTSLRGMTKRD